MKSKKMGNETYQLIDGDIEQPEIDLPFKDMQFSKTVHGFYKDMLVVCYYNYLEGVWRYRSIETIFMQRAKQKVKWLKPINI